MRSYQELMESIHEAICGIEEEGRKPEEIIISDRYKEECDEACRILKRKPTKVFGVPFYYENLQKEVSFYITTREERKCRDT